MSLTDTILIVDDSSFIVEGLVALLKKNYRTLAVYGGQQCLDMLAKEKPSIIILDIMMEPMDGWETLARIKEDPATRSVPVLMFSAKKISAREADEHRINIDDFVTKPVTPKKLIEAIEKVLARQKALRLSIESWRSAGIGEDRIDEYTSLMTNLVVDMSLLQNMKVQRSLVRDDDDRIRSDLEAVIAVIEGRIQEERLLEAKLSRDMQESVAGDAELKKCAGPVPGIHEGEQESNPEEGGSEIAAQPEPSDTQGRYGRKTNPSIREVFVPEESVSPEKIRMEKTPLPDLHQPENPLTVLEEIPEIQESVSLPDTRPVEESLWAEPGMKMLDTSSVHEPEQEPFLIVPSYPKEIISIDPPTNLQPPKTPAEKTLPDRHIPSPDKVLLVLGEKNPAIHNPRLKAVTPDTKQATPAVSLLQAVGSGTDTSIRRSTQGVDRSSGSSTAVGKKMSGPDPETPALGGSILSRILTTIIGLFKRQQK